MASFIPPQPTTKWGAAPKGRLDAVHSVYTSTGGLLSAFMLLEQLFKVAPFGLVRDLAGMLSFSFCQTAHDLKKDSGNLD